MAAAGDLGSYSDLGGARARMVKGRRWLCRLALASVVTTIGLIILGGVVRVTGSGLGCGGEWPLCHGGLLPPLNAADIIEYSHRLVASVIVGPLILATSAMVWIGYRREGWLMVSATTAVVLLLAQGGLGGVTVLTELPGLVVAAHLALAQALLGCLILVAVAANRPAAYHAPTPGGGEDAPGLADGLGRSGGSFLKLAVWTAIATYLLLLSGAYVTATPGALAACPDWPLCQGFTLPTAHLQAIHMLHRGVAVAGGVLIVYTLYRGIKAGEAGLNRPKVIRKLAVAGVGLLLAQLLVGGLAVWLNFPPELRGLHIALATGVWAAMAAVALVSWGPPGKATA